MELSDSICRGYVYVYIYIFCTCVELAESKQCVVGIILPKWPGHFGSSFVSTDFGKFEVRSLTLAFTLCFSAMAPKSFAAAGMDDVMEVDVPPSTLDSEMLSEGSFQLVDQLIEITTEDYQMAEQVAETHKNEEDAASLTLSGAPLDGHAMLQNTTKVDLQKFLAELTAAMQQLATKDQPVDQGASTQPGPAGSGQETGSDTKVLVDFEKVTVDTYRITNGGQELPLVPGNIRNMLRDFTLGDLRDLLSIFGDLEALTSSAFHRILESYGLAIKKLQHEKILSAEDVNATTIYNLEAGPEISGFILHVPMAQAAIGGQVLGVRQDWLPHAQDEGHGHDSGGGWSHLETHDHGQGGHVENPTEGRGDSG